MTKEKIFDVLISPHVSEKSTGLIANGKYVFKVKKCATKKEIAEAVKMLFQVDVTSVNVCNVKGKVKKAGRTPGKRQDWKKAYVTLKEGQTIAEFMGRA
jgi:large subunit ribosomal protein L23